MREPPVLDSSKEYFDAIGSGWDRLRENFFSERVRDKALAAADVRGGRTAVDLGAGTGFITEGLLASDVRVIAVDQSESMLEALRRKFPWPDRVECRTGEAESLPIADRQVDGCLANMYLHHVERPLMAIREMVRVLKPGGRVVVTDLDTQDVSSWFREAGLTHVRVVGLGDECSAASMTGGNAAISIFLAVGTKPEGG
jgi:ubiquinone/menaquinone biosynthesis C-methylase UbiE